MIPGFHHLLLLFFYLPLIVKGSHASQFSFLFSLASLFAVLKVEYSFTYNKNTAFMFTEFLETYIPRYPPPQSRYRTFLIRYGKVPSCCLSSYLPHLEGNHCCDFYHVARVSHRTSYKWNHTVSTLLCLASFTQHDVF